MARRVGSGKGVVVAFEPVRREMIWYGNFTCWREGEATEDMCLAEASGPYRAVEYQLPPNVLTFGPALGFDKRKT